MIGGQVQSTEDHVGKTWYDMTIEEQFGFLIAENAYFLWEQREAEGLPGSAEQDWEEALARVLRRWPVLATSVMNREETIRFRAYANWRQRERYGHDGSAEEDWQKAVESYDRVNRPFPWSD